MLKDADCLAMFSTQMLSQRIPATWDFCNFGVIWDLIRNVINPFQTISDGFRIISDLFGLFSDLFGSFSECFGSFSNTFWLTLLSFSNFKLPGLTQVEHPPGPSASSPGQLKLNFD
jgi:hypothetical protein